MGQFSVGVNTEIERGVWKPGTRLPADSAFAEALPVSLGTIQQALKKLVGDGILERRYRVGTFVRDVEVHSEIRHLRFIAAGERSLAPVMVRVIDISLTQGDQSMGSAMEGVGELVRIRRLCTVNAEFRVFLETFLPGDRFGKLLKIRPAEVNGMSLSGLLKDRFNAPTVRTEHCMRLSTASKEARGWLELDAKTPVIDWCMYSYSHDDALIMAQRATVPQSTAWMRVVST